MKDAGERTPLLHNDDVITRKVAADSSLSENPVKMSRRMLWLFLTAAVGALVVGGIVALVTRLWVDDVITVDVADNIRSDHSRSQASHFRYAAVATDTKDCSSVGLDILAVKQGSVVDAAIAAMLCSGLQSMHSCGIGGGHFMTIFEKRRHGEKKEFATLSARERAPAAATFDMFSNGTSSTTGGLSVGVAGEVAGMYAAWQRFGKLPWRQLFQPSINMARQGIYVGRDLASTISSLDSWVTKYGPMREVLVKEDGSRVREGEYVVNLRLARTLDIIANEGPMAFYNGSLTHDIVTEITENGGIITVKDMESYRAEWFEPYISTLQSSGMRMVSPTTPSSGPILQFMLHILDGYHLKPDDIKGERAANTYHRIIETMKFGYARRTEFGDPQYFNNSEVMKNLASREYIDWTRSKITDNETHEVPYYGPAYSVIKDGGTSHISILAADGAAVSVTTTINTHFGSKLMGNKTGIIYNNEMNDFSQLNNNYCLVSPSDANSIEGGKRPVSSMCPTLFINEDDQVQIVVGASGGLHITAAVLYVMTHNLWLGKSMNTAIDMTRLHNQLDPDDVEYEPHFPQGIIDSLAIKGHDLTKLSNIAAVQAIEGSCNTCRTRVCRQKCIHAVSDGRKGGLPDGF